MKNLVKKPLVLRIVALSILLIAFLLEVVLLRTPFSGNYNSLSIWILGEQKSTNTYSYFSQGIIIAYFLQLVFLLVGVLGIIKKKNGFITLCQGYFLCFLISLLVFECLQPVFTVFALILMVVSFILVFSSFLVIAFSKSAFKGEKPVEKEPIEHSKGQAALGILIIDILSLISLFILVLVLPLYAVNTSSGGRVCILGQILFDQEAPIEDTIYFLSIFLILITCVFFFLNTFSYFFSNKRIFVKKSKTLMEVLLGSSLTYLLLGFVVVFVYAFQKKKAVTLSYIPLIVTAFFGLFFAFFHGRFSYGEEEEEGKKPFSSLLIDPLLYVLTFSAVTVGSLFMNVIKVVIDDAYGQSIYLSGIKLLTDYSSLGSGYQILAFILITMLVCSGLGLILTFAAYLAKYPRYKTIAKAASYINIFFMFVIGISGFYFSIAQEINKENLISVLKLYNLTYDESYDYKMSTDVIYALGVDVVILILMMAKKALTGEKIEVEDLGEGEVNNSKSSPSEVSASLPEKENAAPELTPSASEVNGESKEVSGLNGEEELIKEFDPCPAFSELDKKEEAYQADLASREASLVKLASLKGLVDFVVEYAKDSRLHLSYTPEDIATFISGLGAARLSILQGMSGTGKTSLPKIFAEAIKANCEIVEVESSWKDKNELLGYYNEFSGLYTPKKFTQDLYKAKMNEKIPTFIVLDEMNLSRIEYYFSDFLSLMENEEDKREIKLLNISLARKEADGEHPYKELIEGHTLKVPANIWFIGTANRDESTFVISDKVYDRAATMNFNKRAKKVRDYSAPIPSQFYDYPTLASLFKDALSKHHFDAENNPLIKKTEELLSPYNISFGNRILNQIETFVDIYEECFPEKNVEAEGVETILLSKVVAKLEVKTIENKEELIRDFTDLNLLRCADFISKLNED
ncbi:MAG: hypothetical protein LKJ88_05000 [Bacilli bacterium]|jgi:hypothetical protein|nr:hypothetical protein [Bacilli bacterium]